MINLNDFNYRENIKINKNKNISSLEIEALHK